MRCQVCSESGDWLVLLAPDSRGNHTGPSFVLEQKTMARQAGYCIKHARQAAAWKNREIGLEEA